MRPVRERPLARETRGRLGHSESIAPLLPALTGLSAPIFPLAASVLPTGASVPVGATSGEFLGRGMMIGITATVNTVILGLVPFAGPVLAP